MGRRYGRSLAVLRLSRFGQGNGCVPVQDFFLVRVPIRHSRSLIPTPPNPSTEECASTPATTAASRSAASARKPRFTRTNTDAPLHPTLLSLFILGNGVLEVEYDAVRAPFMSRPHEAGNVSGNEQQESRAGHRCQAFNVWNVSLITGGLCGRF